MNILSPIFHPRRAVRAIALAEEQAVRIAELEAEKAALDVELTASRRRREEAERQAVLCRERLEQAEQAHAGCLRRAAEADALRATLAAERAETGRAAAQISKELDKVEAMRASYERRLAHLRHALAESRDRLKLYSSLDPDAPFIDMQTPASPESKAVGTHPGASARTVGTASGRMHQGASLHSAPPAVHDTDPGPSDWLMPLPE